MRGWILTVSQICLSQVTPMWLSVNVFLYQLIQSATLFSRKCPIVLWSIFENTLFNSFSVYTNKVAPIIILENPDISRACYCSVESLNEGICVSSIWYFHMDSTTDQTCEHISISFKIWLLLPDTKWPKHVNTKISERQSFSYSLDW